MSTNSELIASQLTEALQVQKIWSGVMYNVLNEGLKGGGVIDDTTALQALVNKAIATGRRTIIFPHGTNGQYRVTSLENDDQVDFIGDNCEFVGGYDGVIQQFGTLSPDTPIDGGSFTQSYLYPIVDGGEY